MICFGATLIFSPVVQHDKVAETFNSSPRGCPSDESLPRAGWRALAGVRQSAPLNSSALVTPFQT